MVAGGGHITKDGCCRAPSGLHSVGRRRLPRLPFPVLDRLSFTDLSEVLGRRTVGRKVITPDSCGLHALSRRESQPASDLR